MIERKEGDLVAFKKQSRNGTEFFSGTARLNGKEYWINIFNNKDKNGNIYLSGNLKEKQERPVEKKDDFPF